MPTRNAKPVKQHVPPSKGYIEGEPWIEGNQICVSLVVDEGEDVTDIDSSGNEYVLRPRGNTVYVGKVPLAMQDTLSGPALRDALVAAAIAARNATLETKAPIVPALPRTVDL